jgi:prefoldin subunit 5
LTSGQSFGNTTTFLTLKIEEISERSNLMKQEISNVANQTLFVDDKLQKFIEKQSQETSKYFINSNFIIVTSKINFSLLRYD